MTLAHNERTRPMAGTLSGTAQAGVAIALGSCELSLDCICNERRHDTEGEN